MTQIGLLVLLGEENLFIATTNSQHAKKPVQPLAHKFQG